MVASRSSRHRPVRNLSEAEAYLEGLINVERRPDVAYERLDVEPVRRLLARVDDPHAELSVLHIGGSKGKGSTALLAESILRAAGERVGTFTSPHLERWTERFRIDGHEVAGERLAAAVDRLRPHIDAQRRDDPAHAPTFFDATTAVALLLFAEARLGRVVLEVGLGGRLDSTNVVDSDVACITTVELEHTDKLGDTLAAIAFEKAGIVQPGRPLVLGPLPDEARQVVLAHARACEAPVAELGCDFGVQIVGRDRAGLELELRDGPLELRTWLPLLGDHQAHNAALALACVRRLDAHDDAALLRSAASALLAARLPGRVEVISRDPWIVVDAAHTAASARGLAEVMASTPHGAAHLVLSISAGKDVPAILSALLPHAARVTVTRAEPTRSLTPQEVAVAIRGAAPGVEVRAVPNPHLALRAARAGLESGDSLWVAGSTYLAGIARSVLCGPVVPPSPSRSTASRVAR